MSTETKAGPKDTLDIEGKKFPWEEDTNTVAQIRDLGGLPTDVPVIEVDLQAGTERQLSENEVVELRPGLGFSKKVSFKRGRT
jgi:hypothetical protein